MPRINGGVIGKSNRPYFVQAYGVWSTSEVEIASRSGNWPMAISNISLVVGHNTSPGISAYQWTSGSGFGTKYANPSSLPSGNGNGVSFNPDGTVVVIATATSPYVAAYKWSSAGFGTRYSDPSTPVSGIGYDAAFSPAGDAILMGTNNSPYVSAYPWSDTSGFGTKYSNPSTLPPGVPFDVEFNPLGSQIAISSAASPYVLMYQWSSSTGFGTKYNNPATLPTNTGTAVAYRYTGDVLAVSCYGINAPATPTIATYPVSVLAGFGTRYTSPAAGQQVGSYGRLAFNVDGGAIAQTGNQNTAAAAVTAWPWSNTTGYGTKYADPATSSDAYVDVVTFSPTATEIVLGSNGSSPYIYGYRWTNAGGFGTKYSNPTTPPASYVYHGVAFTTVKA